MKASRGQNRPVSGSISQKRQGINSPCRSINSKVKVGRGAARISRRADVSDNRLCRDVITGGQIRSIRIQVSIVVDSSSCPYNRDCIAAQLIFSDADDIPVGRGIDGSAPSRKNILPFMEAIPLAGRMPCIFYLLYVNIMKRDYQFLIWLSHI